MPKTAMIRARIEPALKTEVENIFLQLGLNATEAINIFYKQVKLRKGIPFDVRIPNAATKKAIHEARSGKGKRFDSADALFKHLEK